jgi:6-pyruvoyltetrahydropterin/6-carboxytetrahydropterin synthase
VTYSITKDFAFSAAHHLAGLPATHPCARLHGHNYRVRVRLTAPLLDDVGFVMDYGDMAPFGRWLDETVDHHDLNEVVDVPNPTAEHLARHFVMAVVTLCKVPRTIGVAVGVSETPKTWAWFTDE